MPPKGHLVMEKAHLYEALYLVNHGIDEAVRGVQRLKKSPKLFMEAYHKSMAGLERRRSIINLQFMLEMRKLEEDDESRFEEEFNVWLSERAPSQPRNLSIDARRRTRAQTGRETAAGAVSAPEQAPEENV
jgi:hypothetical protein